MQLGCNCCCLCCVPCSSSKGAAQMPCSEIRSGSVQQRSNKVPPTSCPSTTGLSSGPPLCSGLVRHTHPKCPSTMTGSQLQHALHARACSPGSAHARCTQARASRTAAISPASARLLNCLYLQQLHAASTQLSSFFGSLETLSSCMKFRAWQQPPVPPPLFKLITKSARGAVWRACGSHTTLPCTVTCS